jgi:hypothetical protein
MASVGAQLGNTNNARGRDWRDAIDWALRNYTGPSIKRNRALRAIATVVVEKALAGDMAAITEIGNRKDGKPIQAIEGGGGLAIIMVKRIVVDADAIEHKQDAIEHDPLP